MTIRRLLLSAWLLAACDDEGIDLERMLQQRKYQAYEENPSFADGRSMRRPPLGTVPRTRELGPPELVSGLSNGAYVTSVPVPATRELLLRGRNRFEVFCAACHGASGDGRSKVAENMSFRPPPSLHEARIRAFPPGQLFRVISEGYGLMPAYADRLDVRDRWAVVSYLGALQLSQHAELARLPAALKQDAERWLK